MYFYIYICMCVCVYLYGSMKVFMYICEYTKKGVLIFGILHIDSTCLGPITLFYISVVTVLGQNLGSFFSNFVLFQV